MTARARLDIGEARVAIDEVGRGHQAAAIAATMACSGAVSFAVLNLIAVVVPLRASADEEIRGLDIQLPKPRGKSIRD